MSTITFDTLKFVEKLEKAGVPREQAKAEAEALAEVLDSGAQELATKKDLAVAESTLRKDIAEMKYDLLKWVIGLALAQFALMIGILLRIPH